MLTEWEVYNLIITVFELYFVQNVPEGQSVQLLDP